MSWPDALELIPSLRELSANETVGRCGIERGQKDNDLDSLAVDSFRVVPRFVHRGTQYPTQVRVDLVKRCQGYRDGVGRGRRYSLLGIGNDCARHWHGCDIDGPGLRTATRFGAREMK